MIEYKFPPKVIGFSCYSTTCGTTILQKCIDLAKDDYVCTAMDIREYGVTSNYVTMIFNHIPDTFGGIKRYDVADLYKSKCENKDTAEDKYKEVAYSFACNLNYIGLDTGDWLFILLKKPTYDKLKELQRIVQNTKDVTISGMDVTIYPEKCTVCLHKNKETKEVDTGIRSITLTIDKDSFKGSVYIMGKTYEFTLRMP